MNLQVIRSPEPSHILDHDPSDYGSSEALYSPRDTFSVSSTTLRGSTESMHSIPGDQSLARTSSFATLAASLTSYSSSTLGPHVYIPPPPAASPKRWVPLVPKEFYSIDVKKALALTFVIAGGSVFLESLFFIIGCFILRECSVKRVDAFEKEYHADWVRVGAAGGVFAIIPFFFLLYIYYHLYEQLKMVRRPGMRNFIVASTLILPISFVGSSIFGAWVGCELINRTQSEQFSVGRAFVIVLIGSVPISALFWIVLVFPFAS